MPEDEAKRRQDHLKEMRDKFLSSRQQRLAGKPYKKPRPKAARKKIAEAQEAEANKMRADATAAGLLGHSPAGLVPNLLQNASAAQLAGLQLHGAGLLGQANHPMLGLREQLLLGGGMGALSNPLIVAQRNLLLNQALGGGLAGAGTNPLLSPELARHQLLSELQRESQRNAFIQQALAAPVPGQRVQEEKSDLADQIRAGQKRSRANHPPPSPPGKRRKDP